MGSPCDDGYEPNPTNRQDSQTTIRKSYISAKVVMVYLVLSTEINKSEDQEHELFPITESFFSLSFLTRRSTPAGFLFILCHAMRRLFLRVL
jgi:hypothetical protein